MSRKICGDSDDRNAIRRLSQSRSDRTVKLNDAYVQNSCQQFIAKGEWRCKNREAPSNTGIYKNILKILEIFSILYEKEKI